MASFADFHHSIFSLNLIAMLEEFFLTVLQVADSMMRISTPLIFASLAGLFSERSGIVNIALEGKMLGAAFSAATVAYLLDSAMLGLLAGLTTAVLLSLLHGYACIRHHGEQIVSGLAINLIVAGLTVVIAEAVFRQGGRTPTLNNNQRFLPIELPGAAAIESWPIIGPIYSNLISGHSILVYVALICVPLTAWIINKTRFGLYMRAAGDNPEALYSAGVSVPRIRFSALVICGILVGLAGCYLSQGQNAFFIRNMTAGQGYIALAALIFGKWRPGFAFMGCLLFSVFDAIALRLQGTNIVVGSLDLGEVPVPLIQILPYLLTVILLAGFIGSAAAPLAIGKPFMPSRDH